MTKETNWTPGPWVVETPMESICFSIVDNAEQVYDWRMIANATWDDKDSRETGQPFIDKSEAKANAHLIAAAPELYEALELILPLAKGYAAANRVGNNREHIASSEAILAKARGES